MSAPSSRFNNVTMGCCLKCRIHLASRIRRWITLVGAEPKTRTRGSCPCWLKCTPTGVSWAFSLQGPAGWSLRYFPVQGTPLLDMQHDCTDTAPKWRNVESDIAASPEEGSALYVCLHVRHLLRQLLGSHLQFCLRGRNRMPASHWYDAAPGSH